MHSYIHEKGYIINNALKSGDFEKKSTNIVTKTIKARIFKSDETWYDQIIEYRSWNTFEHIWSDHYICTKLTSDSNPHNINCWSINGKSLVDNIIKELNPEYFVVVPNGYMKLLVEEENPRSLKRRRIETITNITKEVLIGTGLCFLVSIIPIPYNNSVQQLKMIGYTG